MNRQEVTLAVFASLSKLGMDPWTNDFPDVNDERYRSRHCGLPQYWGASSYG